MDNMKVKLNACAQRAEKYEVMSVYPFYPQFMSALDEIELQQSSDKYGDALLNYLPATYYADKTAPPEMISCQGKLVGRPMPLPLAGCAEACNQVKFPIRCAAFQYFQIMDGDVQKPLCFMYQEIDAATTYRCEGHGLHMDGFLQVNATRNFRGHDASSHESAAICENIKQ